MRSIQIGKKIQVEEKKLTMKEICDFIKELEHDDIVLAACPCRTDAEISGPRKCHDKNPIGACVFLGISAVHIEAKGIGKRVSKQIALEYIDFMISLGVCATIDNELLENSVICLCCGCCCSHLRVNFFKNDSDSPFSELFPPTVDENCLLCGKCAKVCLFDAIKIDRKKEIHDIAVEKCIGCGVCAFVCPNDALELVKKNKMERLIK